MGMALAIKRGVESPQRSKAAAKIARSMSTTDLRDFARKVNRNRKKKAY